MKKKDIPNLISILRILLVVPLAILLIEQNYFYALLLFFVGGISDGLDGFLARRYYWQSRLGVILDPMGDKLMMLVGYLLLGWNQLLAWWLVALVIGRDVIIVFGSLMYRLIIGKEEVTPIWISKVNTAFQIMLVLLIILNQLIALPAIIIQVCITVVTITTVLSGYGYISEWGGKARKYFSTGEKHV